MQRFKIGLFNVHKPIIMNEMSSLLVKSFKCSAWLVGLTKGASPGDAGVFEDAWMFWEVGVTTVAEVDCLFWVSWNDLYAREEVTILGVNLVVAV